MEEKLKEIVAGFIKLSPELIGPDTPIDRRAVQSSIVLHRMYARLAEEGFTSEDYGRIKVFGDLLPAAAGRSFSGTSPDVTIGPLPVGIPGHGAAGAGIGIDIEEISAMPRVNDFRTEDFYKMNFTPEEIAYCILQQDPYASFTGLFAAKEAIVKAGERRRGEPFNKIPIGHSPEGKPLYPGFTISISHTPGLAVAVAARPASDPVQPAAPPPPHGKAGSSSRLAWLALLVGIIALLAALIHRA